MYDEFDDSVDYSESSDYSSDSYDYSEPVESADSFAEDVDYSDSSVDEDISTDDYYDEIAEDTSYDSSDTYSDDYTDDITEDISEDSYESESDLEDYTEDIPEDTTEEYSTEEYSDDSYDDIAEDSETDSYETDEAEDEELADIPEDIIDLPDLPEEESTEDEIETIEEEPVEDELTEDPELLEEEPTEDELTEDSELLEEEPVNDELSEETPLEDESTAEKDSDSMDQLDDTESEALDQPIENDPESDILEDAELDQQAQSLRDRTIKAGPLKSAALAGYMDAALKADDAGYKTVKGYTAGLGANAAMSAAGSLSHMPPDVTSSYKESANSASHIFDEMYAANHPGEVIDFSPSPVPQEIIDKNTLVLDENPYGGGYEIPGVEIDVNSSDSESIKVTDIPDEPIAESSEYVRKIPGTPGVVTGGSSTDLGKNMMEDMGVPRSTKWGSSGYQAHHIIPKEFADHPVIQKIGMDMDDASNGIFLRKPNDGVNVKSVHFGYHDEYSSAVSDYLDSLDPNESPEVLEKQVYDMQKSLKTSLENGVPLYKKKPDSVTGPVDYKHKGGGATQEMWSESILKNINKDGKE